MSKDLIGMRACVVEAATDRDNSTLDRTIDAFSARLRLRASIGGGEVETEALNGAGDDDGNIDEDSDNAEKNAVAKKKKTERVFAFFDYGSANKIYNIATFYCVNNPLAFAGREMKTFTENRATCRAGVGW